VLCIAAGHQAGTLSRRVHCKPGRTAPGSCRNGNCDREPAWRVIVELCQRVTCRSGDYDSGQQSRSPAVITNNACFHQDCARPSAYQSATAGSGLAHAAIVTNAGSVESRDAAPFWFRLSRRDSDRTHREFALIDGVKNRQRLASVSSLRVSQASRTLNARVGKGGEYKLFSQAGTSPSPGRR